MTDYTALLAALDKRVGDWLKLCAAATPGPTIHIEKYFNAASGATAGADLYWQADIDECGGVVDHAPVIAQFEETAMAEQYAASRTITPALLRFAQAHTRLHILTEPPQLTDHRFRTSDEADTVDLARYWGRLDYMRALTDVLAAALEVTACSN